MVRIPIFVSSTFNDFHVERDALRSKLLPILNEVAAPYGATVTLIDLRWGVVADDSVNDAREESILAVCRDEINQASPLFIGLLGSRFGTPVSVAKSAWLLGSDISASNGKAASVTAHEVGQALEIPAMRPVFAVRHLTGPHPRGWADVDQTDVQLLRDRVREAACQQSEVTVLDYTLAWSKATGPSAHDVTMFVESLAGFVKPLVRSRARDLCATDVDSTGSRTTRSPSRVVREPVIDNITAVLRSAEGLGCVLLGPSGIGKSTLSVDIVDRLEADHWNIVRVSIDSLLGTATTRSIVSTVCTGLGVSDVTPSGSISTTAKEEEDWLLTHWKGVVADLPDRTLVVLDGLDSLAVGPDRTAMPFLTDLRGTSARFLVTTTDDDQARLLDRRGMTVVTTPPLEPGDVVLAVQGHAATERRELPVSVTEILASHPRSGLWTSLAVARLVGLGAADFKRAEQMERNGIPPGESIKRVLSETARALPDSDAALATTILKAATTHSAHGSTLLGLLATCRSGLSTEDLAALTGASQLEISRLRWTLGPHLADHHHPGRLTFDHGLVRAAASEGVSQAQRRHLHKELAGYAVSQIVKTDVSDRAADAVWHSLLSNSVEALSSTVQALQEAGVPTAVLSGQIVVAMSTSEREQRPVFAHILESIKSMSEDAVRYFRDALAAVFEQDQDWNLTSRQRASLLLYLSTTFPAVGEGFSTLLALRLGEAYMEDRQFRRARIAFEKTPGGDPGIAARGQMRLAELCATEGKFAMGLTHARTAVDLVREEPSYHIHAWESWKLVRHLTWDLGSSEEYAAAITESLRVGKAIQASGLITPSLHEEYRRLIAESVDPRRPVSVGATARRITEAGEVQPDVSPVDESDRRELVEQLDNRPDDLKLLVALSTKDRELAAAWAGVDPGRARELLNEALEVASRLAAIAPGSPVFRKLLADAHAAGADIVESGNWEARLGPLRKALAVLDALVDEFPLRPYVLAQTSVQAKLGLSEHLCGDTAEGSRHCLAALETLSLLSEEAEDRATIERRLFAAAIMVVTVLDTAELWADVLLTIRRAANAASAPEDEDVLVGQFARYLASIAARAETAKDPVLLHELGDTWRCLGRALVRFEGQEERTRRMIHGCAVQGDAFDAQAHALKKDWRKALEYQQLATAGYRIDKLKSRALLQDYLAALDAQHRAALGCGERELAHRTVQELVKESRSATELHADDPRFHRTYVIALLREVALLDHRNREPGSGGQRQRSLALAKSILADMRLRGLLRPGDEALEAHVERALAAG